MAKKTFSNPVINELKGSAWFKRPEATSENQTPSPAPAAAQKAAPPASIETPVQETAAIIRTQRSDVRSGHVYEAVNRTKRSTVQHPNIERTQRRAYDLLESQIISLRRIRATRELSHNQTVSLSQLVREAVDLLLKQEGL